MVPLFKSLGVATPLLSILVLPALSWLPDRDDDDDDDHGGSGQVLEFEEAFLVFEVNETDQDGEVLLRMKAPEGLRELELEDPHGKTVLKLRVKGRLQHDVGLQQFLIESGEPDIESVLAAFPEGTYELEGRTISGHVVEGEVSLSHAMAPAPSFFPPDGSILPPNGLVVQWSSVAGAAAYVLELEQDELGVNLTMTVPADVLSFAIPDGFLIGGTEYELGISTVSFNGNVAVAEGAFTTTF